MKESQRQHLDELAAQLVTPERYFEAPKVREIGRLTVLEGLSALPGNKWTDKPPEPPQAA